MSYKIPDFRCEEIKKIVTRTFIKLGIHDLPINAFQIAEKLGVKIVPYSSKSEKTRLLMTSLSEDGFSIKYDGIWYIFYNDLMNDGRINNTIAHECGHIILDHSQESDLAEAEANFFAKYALAPPVLIHGLNLKSASEIYMHFDISREAARYAYDYYRKRVTYGPPYLLDYEISLLKQFGLDALRGGDEI